MADFTLEDLEHAEQVLGDWQKRFGDSNSNNPNKFRGQINAAVSMVEMIEADLKRTGLIPQTAQEVLENALDKLFPRARSREIVEFEGKMYQRIFTPLRFSRSRKTVTKWGKNWKLID
jgi:hypothetical protein